MQLVTASGGELPLVDHIKAPIQLGELQIPKTFVVVENLVGPVVDFLA